jgi:iron complex transport system ATP-binding protein
MSRKTSKKNEPVVRLNKVSLHRDRELLHQVNWTIRRGEHWVVLGRNGAGKTLLLRMVAGYMWPSNGEVDVLTERFGDVDLRELRQDIGWVSSALAEKIPGWDSALDVVLSGFYATFGLYERPDDELVDRAESLMKDMNLGDLASQRFDTLSAGEKQRVLVARARMPEPDLLILDEPCGALDLAARERFLGVVDKMAREPNGPTLIMVTHRVEEITPGFTHGLLLRRGKVTAQGPLEKVMTDELLSEALEIPVTLKHRQGRYEARVNS